MSNYTTHEPAVFDLLAAAGCTPESSSTGNRGWTIAFRDRNGERVELTGKTFGGYGGSLHAEREAVVSWLRKSGMAPAPEAVASVRLAQQVGWAAQESRDTREALAALTLSVAALRAAKVDDGAIRVWRFHDAPPELRALSNHGGDEDWLALVPAGFDDWIPWADSGTSFGCCSVSEHVLDGGARVLIGAHA